MARFFMAAVLCGLLAGPVLASTVFQDDFESGVSGSTWALVNAGQSLLDGDPGGHHLGNQSAKQVNAFTNGVSDVYYMKTQSTAFPNPGPITAGNKEVAAVMFWDDNIQTDSNADGAINIGGALMLAGSYASTDFYQIGVNSGAVAGNTDITNYYVRTAAEGSVVTSIPRSQGWHELRIEVLPYTGLAGDVQFYIDGTNVNPAGFGKRRVAGPVDMNELRLGLSVRTPDSPFWFDNVNLSMVPEPASLVLLALGGCGLIARRRR